MRETETDGQTDGRTDRRTDGQTDRHSATTKALIITGKHSLQPRGQVQSDSISSEDRVQNEGSVNADEAPTEVETRSWWLGAELKGRRR